MSQTIPAAPFSWSSLWQGLKIFIVIVVFLSAQQGVQAFTNTFDWTKLTVAGEVVRVSLAVGMGIIFGAIQGSLRAIQILMVIWAGPSVWGYLGPILATAAVMVNTAATATVKVVRSLFSKKETTTA